MLAICESPLDGICLDLDFETKLCSVPRRIWDSGIVITPAPNVCVSGALTHFNQRPNGDAQRCALHCCVWRDHSGACRSIIRVFKIFRERARVNTDQRVDHADSATGWSFAPVPPHWSEYPLYDFLRLLLSHQLERILSQNTKARSTARSATLES
jgi:hypothetical protein